MSLKDRKIKRVHDRIQRENFAKAAFSGAFKTSSLFDTNADLLHMRKPFTEYFMRKYDEAFILFIDGKWQFARKKFREILTSMLPDDPLCRYHLDYMGDRDYAPDNWQGYKFLAD